MSRLCILILLSFISSNICKAQNSNQSFNNKLQRDFLTDSSKWSIEVPIWIPGFRGEFAYGDIELEGEDGASPENPIEPGWKPGDNLSRIFGKNGNLNFFFMNRIAYKNKRFYSQFDAFSGSVGGKIYFRYNNVDVVKARFTTVLTRLYAGYKFVDEQSVSGKTNFNLYGYGGMRMHYVYVKSQLTGLDTQVKVEPLWVEPILGVRNELVLNRWQFIASGDIGSFNINDKFSYMVNFYAYYRLSNLLSVKVGWCGWDIKYNDKYSGEDLSLKMHLEGPASALTFHF